jgi:hypothetical protein
MYFYISVLLLKRLLIIYRELDQDKQDLVKFFLFVMFDICYNRFFLF